ncbi:MAG: hypothetical protein AB7T10_05780 [bacterium]
MLKSIFGNVVKFSLLLIFIFNSLVFALRIPVSLYSTEIISLSGFKGMHSSFLEFSTLTLVASLAVSIISIIFAVGLLLSENADSRDYSLLSFISAMALLSVQSADILHFVFLSYMAMFIFLLYDDNTSSKSGFAKGRLLSGIFISIAIAASAAALSITAFIESRGIIPGEQNFNLMLILLSLALFIQTGGFPFNIFSYDYLANLKEGKRAMWYSFISIPAVLFIGKSFFFVFENQNSLYFVYLLSTVSVLFSSLLLFVKKNISEFSSSFVILLSSETLSVYLFGVIKGDSFYSSGAIQLIFMGVLLLISIDLLKREFIENLRGAFKNKSFVVLSFLISAFSISFIPPSLGFIVKYEMIKSLVSENRYFPVGILLTAFTIEAFVLLRMLFTMFITEQTEDNWEKRNVKFELFLLSAALFASVFFFYTQRQMKEYTSAQYREVAREFIKSKEAGLMENSPEMNQKQFLIE